MSEITVNGVRVATCSITMPYYGAWVADVDLIGAAEIANPVTLVVGDLTLAGTVVQQALFTNDRKARLVGGGGGWGNTIPAKGYSHVIGVKASTILEDAAREVGESIVLDADRTLGLLYAREEAPAERCLHLIVGTEWWIDEAGVTQTKARASTAVVAPFTLVSRNGSLDSFDVATEFIAGWLPGRTFSCPTVPDVQTISSVTIEANNEGKVRLRVLGTSVAIERLRTNIRAIIRAEIAALSYGVTWEYTVAPSLGAGTVSTLDVVPVEGSIMPAITKVPLAAGLGVVAAPLAGTRCRVRFVNGNPWQPEIVSLGATTEHLMTIEACALLIYNFMATLMASTGPGPLTAAILQPLMGVAMTGAIAAQAAPAPPGLVAQAAAAAALQAGFAAGTTPSPAMFAAWQASIATLLATKTLNVSGSFPSVGVPNG